MCVSVLSADDRSSGTEWEETARANHQRPVRPEAGRQHG